ncbi:MAG: TetR/AcrR family transcriptional regulator [Hyphomicrobiales bacterium]
MRYKPGQKEQTAQRMRQVANRCFKSHGYAGIGVNGIAATAKVTSGAFYAHFGSKQNAFHAALEFGLDEVITAIPKFQEDNGLNWVKAFVDYYLSPAHQADLEGGCAMTTLSPEVVRADPETHQIYENKMQTIITLVADGLDGAEKTNRAWAMISLLIGSLTVVRAIHEQELVENITPSLKISAVQAAGQTRIVSK